MELPQPPKSLLRQGAIKSAGIFMLGLASVVTSVTAAVALDTVRDTQSESQCRAGLTNETARLEGEINTTGWTALLRFRGGASPEEAQKVVDEMQALVERWEDAQDRRDRASEICED